MKIGMRKPSLKKSIKARTTGRIKREIKSTINPLYGKKGVGFIKDPSRSLKNKIYKKTTFGLPDIFKLFASANNSGSTNGSNESNVIPNDDTTGSHDNKPGTSLFNQILNHTPGFRKRSINHIIIASAYYLLTLLVAICLGKDFFFALVFFWSVPFCAFAVIDAIKYKDLLKLLPIPICFFLLLISSAGTSVYPTEIHLNNQEITFEDINQEQSVSYSVTPHNADTSKIELVSSNEEVAYFSGDTLCSKSEGETTVYAALKNSSVKSEEINVVVKDKNAEAERAAQEAARQAEEKAKQEAERQAEEAKQAAERQAAEAAAAAAANNSVSQSSNITEDTKDSETVYVGKTGNKYHRKSCHTLKSGGRAISLSEAKKTRKPCSICNP